MIPGPASDRSSTTAAGGRPAPGWARQVEATVRLEWGASGAAALAAPQACLVVVDVLSFTTTTTIAVSRGSAVLPYRWKDERAAAYASAHAAVLARGRRTARADHPWSLSPAAIRDAPVAERLVLPSPNGSTIALGAAPHYADVIAASLRNAAAVARWLLARGYAAPSRPGVQPRPVVIVPAGEQWEDGTLRPCLEDLLGAGLLASALARAGAALSPEARAAASAAAVGVPEAVRGCASGLELVSGGFGEDVELAVEVDVDEVVPVLDGPAFVAAAP